MQQVSSSENRIHQYFFLFPLSNVIDSYHHHVIHYTLSILSTSPHLLLLATKIWSLFCEVFFFFFFFKSQHSSEIMQYLFLSDLIHLLQCSQSPTVLPQLAGFPSLYDWVISLCICQNFFIHSPINGHLGNFHVLDIVDNTSLNMRQFRCLFSKVFLFPLDIFSEVELLGHVAVVF